MNFYFTYILREIILGHFSLEYFTICRHCKKFHIKPKLKDIFSKFHTEILLTFTFSCSQVDYQCFDFVARHHNIIRYRKGVAMITNDFHTVCSWVQFKNDVKWKYDLMLSKYHSHNWKLDLEHCRFYVTLLLIVKLWPIDSDPNISTHIFSWPWPTFLEYVALPFYVDLSKCATSLKNHYCRIYPLSHILIQSWPRDVGH